MRYSKATVAAAALALIVSGCVKDEFGNPRPMTRAEKGAIVGAVGGAVVVGLAAKDKRSKKMLLGAIGGGIAGAAVGHYMDTQRKDFEKQLASEVSAGAIGIDKRADHSLLVTMTAHTAFDFDSTAIKQGFRPSLDKIANILVKYGKTNLTVIGHTDNVGSQTYNQGLSERRAQGVEDYLRTRGVIPQRLGSLGRGESEPRASNANEPGRALNRRVEILIEPVVEEAG